MAHFHAHCHTTSKQPTATATAAAVLVIAPVLAVVSDIDSAMKIVTMAKFNKFPASGRAVCGLRCES